LTFLRLLYIITIIDITHRVIDGYSLVKDVSNNCVGRGKLVLVNVGEVVMKSNIFFALGILLVRLGKKFIDRRHNADSGTYIPNLYIDQTNR
jgi:hypothetical protein